MVPLASPRPAPRRRGRIVGRASAKTGRFDFAQNWPTVYLSLRERAGVRGKEANRLHQTGRSPSRLSRAFSSAVTAWSFDGSSSASPSLLPGMILGEFIADSKHAVKSGAAIL